MNPSSFPNLNSSQSEAVRYRGPGLLIVAGPGTGKTHTLTCRIADSVHGLPPGQRLLAITFTTKAAQEMRQRLALALPDTVSTVETGTFHQFCLSVLRAEPGLSGLPPDFRVATPAETEVIAKELWPQAKARERRQFLEEISLWKGSRFEKTMPARAVAYNQRLRERALLDFDDLLLETLLLLRREAEILGRLRFLYQHIFVDEYQDINGLQHALLKTLVGPEGTITAIGDPNQAIYGFRGADARLFERFSEDFTGAVTLALEENYRSAPNLLSASGQVMSGHSRFPVPERTARIYAQGRLVIHAAATDKAEAEYVVHTIEKLVGGTSMFSRDSGRVADEEGERSFGDIAVLYRLNTLRRPLEEALARSGIPYQIAGPQPDDEQDGVGPLTGEEQIEFNAEKVTLMTLHSAKGLEFPVVFIVGCEDNLLPLNLETLTADPVEERRLFYVGMTRAKDRLFLLRARRRMLYGKTREWSPSPFLSDIEEGLKEYEHPTPRPVRKSKDDSQMTLF